MAWIVLALTFGLLIVQSVQAQGNCFHEYTCPSTNKQGEIVQYYYDDVYSPQPSNCSMQCDNSISNAGVCVADCMAGAVKNKEGRCEFLEDRREDEKELLYFWGKKCELLCNSSSPCTQVYGTVWGNGKCKEGYAADGHASKCVEMHCTNKSEEVVRNCSSCMPGYWGSTCVKECTYGTFGKWDHYRQICRQSCNCQRRCNVATGECTSGCRPGYQGWSCQERCKDGTWGEGNATSCPNVCECDEGGMCDKATGSCDLSKYSERFAGPNCTMPCVAGRWGANCGQECFCRAVDDECDAATGECMINRVKYICENGTKSTNDEYDFKDEPREKASLLFHNVGLQKMFTESVTFYGIETRYDEDWVHVAEIPYSEASDTNKTRKAFIYANMLFGTNYIRLVPYDIDDESACIRAGAHSPMITLHRKMIWEYDWESPEKDSNEHQICFSSEFGKTELTCLPGWFGKHCNETNVVVEGALQNVHMLAYSKVSVTFKYWQYEEGYKNNFRALTYLQYRVSGQEGWNNITLGSSIHDKAVSVNLTAPIQLTYWYTEYQFRLLYCKENNEEQVIGRSNIFTRTSGCLYHGENVTADEKERVCHHFCYCGGVYCLRVIRGSSGDGCGPTDDTCVRCTVRIPTNDEIHVSTESSDTGVSVTIDPLPDVAYYNVSCTVRDDEGFAVFSGQKFVPGVPHAILNSDHQKILLSITPVLQYRSHLYAGFSTHRLVHVDNGSEAEGDGIGAVVAYTLTAVAACACVAVLTALLVRKDQAKRRLHQTKSTEKDRLIPAMT